MLVHHQTNSHWNMFWCLIQLWWSIHNAGFSPTWALKLNMSSVSLTSDDTWMWILQHGLLSCTVINVCLAFWVNYCFPRFTAVDDVSILPLIVCIAFSHIFQPRRASATPTWPTPWSAKLWSTCSRRRTALRTSGGEWFWPGRPSWTRGFTSRMRKTLCSTCISCSMTIKTEIWGSCQTLVSVFSVLVMI